MKNKIKTLAKLSQIFSIIRTALVGAMLVFGLLLLLLGFIVDIAGEQGLCLWLIVSLAIQGSATMKGVGAPFIIALYAYDFGLFFTIMSSLLAAPCVGSLVLAIKGNKALKADDSFEGIKVAAGPVFANGVYSLYYAFTVTGVLSLIAGIFALRYKEEGKEVSKEESKILRVRSAVEITKHNDFFTIFLYASSLLVNIFAISFSFILTIFRILWLFFNIYPFPRFPVGEGLPSTYGVIMTIMYIFLIFVLIASLVRNTICLALSIASYVLGKKQAKKYEEGEKEMAIKHGMVSSIVMAGANYFLQGGVTPPLIFHAVKAIMCYLAFPKKAKPVEAR